MDGRHNRLSQLLNLSADDSRGFFRLRGMPARRLVPYLIVLTEEIAQ